MRKKVQRQTKTIVEETTKEDHLLKLIRQEMNSPQKVNYNKVQLNLN